MHLVLLTALFALSSPRPASACPSAVAWPEPTDVDGLVLPTLSVPLARSSESAERVVVPTEDKLSLAGSYWAPRSKQAAPAALLIHGAGGRRADLADLAERLNKAGFAVLAVDLRGHGESATEDSDWSNLDATAQERLWAFATRDIKAGAGFLRERKEVHSASIVLIGHRAGSALVARHAIKDENVRGVALFDPPTDPTQLLGFHLDKDLEALGGLPTYISVPKERQDVAQRLADEGQRANGGLQFIRVSAFGADGGDVLQDAQAATEACKWLKERGFPNKSRQPGRR